MSRTITLWGYALIAIAAVICQAAALLNHRRPTIGQAIRSLTSHPARRRVVLAAWLWLGWHTFVRGSYP